MVIGLGGQTVFSGVIPFFGTELPALATAAIFGILLNLFLSIKKTHHDEHVKVVEEKISE